MMTRCTSDIFTKMCVYFMEFKLLKSSNAHIMTSSYYFLITIIYQGYRRLTDVNVKDLDKKEVLSQITDSENLDGDDNDDDEDGEPGRNL
jgi:hypothetical protein